jgi:L-threonylcarbamoyladenylate synthase
MILRPGIITAENVEAVLGEKVALDPTLNRRKDHSGEDGEEDFAPKAPGMKYTHYAPKADMTVIEGQIDRVKSEIERLKGLNEKLGLKVGVILFEEKAFIEAAHEFFAKLREMDDEGVDLILAGALSEQDGVGFAVMNRMLKSAGYNIARV